MKNSRIFTVLILAFFQVFFQQCYREVYQIVEPNITQDTDTPTDLNEWIELQTTTITPLNKLVLPNGRSIEEFLLEYKQKYKGGRFAAGELNPEDQKNMLIASMGKVAQRLCNKDNFNYEAEAPNGPKQKGLAYSWGQENYKERLLPPSTPFCPKDAKCPFKIYGLDCSGLFANILREANDPSNDSLIFSRINKEHSSTLGTEKYWTTLLKQNKKFEKIEVKKKGELEVDKIESGDIIYWSKGHVGYVFTGSDGNLKIFQSNGKSSDINKRNGGPKCEDKEKSDCNCPSTEDGACKTNYESEKRGVHEFSLSKKILDAFGNYEILRFTTKLQGKWSILLKCDWAEENNVAVKFDINIPEIQDGKSFTTQGQGKDYDGSILEVGFIGNYNPVSRKLKGRLTINPNDPTPRIDDFETTMPADAKPTEWITLVSVQKGPNTCIGQIKLERTSNESDSGKRLAALTKQNVLK